MKDTSDRLRVYELIPRVDGRADLNVTLPYSLNNIGQRLTDLMESYRYFYFGLESPAAAVASYKRTVELKFPYSIAKDEATVRQLAGTLLNANFVLNTVEIVTEELVEILLLLTAVQLIKEKTPYKTIDKTIHSKRKELLGARFPRLLDLLEAEVGNLTFKSHVTSINRLRRTLVHRSGVVDSELLVLNLYVPEIVAEGSFAPLSDPVVPSGIDRAPLLGKNIIVTWERDEVVSIDYELCFRILFTVVSFFGHVVNIAIPKKHPELVVANQAL